VNANYINPNASPAAIERAELVASLIEEIHRVRAGWIKVLAHEPNPWILVDGHDRAEHRAPHSIHLQIEWLRLETLARVERYRVEPCARFFIERGAREHLMPQRLHAFAGAQVDKCTDAIDHLLSVKAETLDAVVAAGKSAA